MVSRDTRFIRTLINATTDNKIIWLEVEKKYYKGFFTEAGEIVNNAYYFEREQGNKIIVYKANIFINDAFGDDIERTNIHIAITKPDEFKLNYKISDFELDKDVELWKLYKLIQRQESKVEELMDGVIADFGDNFEF